MISNLAPSAPDPRGRRRRVVAFGLGPVGCGIADLAARKREVAIVGAVALRNAGKDSGEIANPGRRLGIRVSDEAAAVLKRVKPEVVRHATGSSFPAVYITGAPDMEGVIKGGTPGDIATASLVVKAIPKIVNASPGLITRKDIPIVSATPNREKNRGARSQKGFGNRSVADG